MSTAPYRLVDGSVKIQIEDILGTRPGGGWVYQAPGKGNNPGAEGAHYYYRSQTAEGSHKTVPDAGRFTITLDIEEAGVYGLLLRASRDTATPGDARNDIWIRVDGDTEAVMPDGTAPLTTSDGFAKFKSAPPAKKWVDAKMFSTPAHGDANAPSDVELGVGTHTITFAPRSTGYHIDSLKVVTRSLLPTPPEPEPEEPVTVRARVATGADDFETLHGAANNDLDFGTVNGKANTVGLRFTGLDIAEGAEIESAYFVFASNSVASGGSLDIEIQDGLGARDFVSGTWVNSRAWLDDSVTWTPGAWAKGESYRSADVSELIETLLAGGGLDAEDALAFRITGTGTRSAHAVEGSGAAPELVVTWLA